MMQADDPEASASMPNHLVDDERFQLVDSFGVWRLSISEAAELIALDRWFSGELAIEAPEGWDGSSRDPKLLALLRDEIELFEKRLTVSVELEFLEAAAVRRDFDNRLVPDDTYIEYGKLIDWLEERGYAPGDHFNEYWHDEASIAEALASQAAYLRAAKRTWKLKEALSGDPDAVAKAAIEENRRLREQIADLKSGHPAKVDRPLTVRQRRTLLIVIAALCWRQKLDPQGRGTAQRIREMTEELGAPVDDGTIARLLAEVPDALETRMR